MEGLWLLFIILLSKSSIWYTEKHIFKIIIYSFNTSKCAANYAISFELYGGFIDQKILKIWRQESWPFGPGWAAHITSIGSWTFSLPCLHHQSCLMFYLVDPLNIKIADFNLMSSKTWELYLKKKVLSCKIMCLKWNQMLSTVGPWDARFLGNWKPRAAQNSVL